MPRTYACCYCNQKFNRGKLPKHMESHESEIPENLTPYQVAYDIINDHPDHHGRCTICGKITNWSTKNQKYHRICRDKRCAEAIKKTYQERMIKVYNKPHLMDDVNHLEKMLASRKISGKYKWSDGTEFTYTGSYEKNFLEFLDKVMNYESREIISPGPVLEYDYKGKKHKWITDVMILPYNLIVEIKDGGDNKNGNKAWKGTREKTIAKEVMITNLGKYNYIRLTNNDFAQFLGIIAELKMQIVDDTVSPLYRIHESTNLFLDSKEDREKLLDFTQNEIRELPREKDTKFIWPDQLMQSKRGNCVDVALLWYDYCKKRNREACLIRIGYSYKHSNSNNTSLSHQFHVMCMYKEDGGNWCIVNNVGPNKLSKELFIGNKSKESTISLFAKEFLPCLKGYIESIYPDAIMVEPITQIAPDDKMDKFYSTYFNKYNGNKQLFMKNIFTEDTSLDEGFIKDTVISTINGIRKIGNSIERLNKKQQQIPDHSNQNIHKVRINEKAIQVKNTILQMKPSDGFDFEECMSLSKVIDSISEEKLIKYLYKYGGYTLKELLDDYNETCDIPIKNFFKGKKVTKTIGNEGEYDLYFYCYDTKKWYQYHHEDEPLISINKGMDYSTMKQEFKKSYSSDSLEEDSLPEAIDNSYTILEENDLDKELEYLHEGFLDTIKGLTPSTQRAIENIKAPLKAMVTGEHNGKKLDNVTRFIGASADALTSAVIYLPAGVLLDALLLITIGWLKFLTRNEKEIKPEDLPKIKQQILKIQSSMQKCKTTSNHKRYNDLYWKLEFLKGKYNACAKANGIKPLPVKGPIKEDSLPEAIDNPYMLREAQEWEHLTHMWSNAIDDIIGNVTNSPFEVAKGSYIDHDPETGKEVCVMRTIRPKAELKNREYRDRLKKQMYHLQQKINKAYNVHPSVMFIQYPIDNTNLTEGLIIGITKTSR